MNSRNLTAQTIQIKLEILRFSSFSWDLQPSTHLADHQETIKRSSFATRVPWPQSRGKTCEQTASIWSVNWRICLPKNRRCSRCFPFSLCCESYNLQQLFPFLEPFEVCIGLKSHTTIGPWSRFSTSGNQALSLITRWLHRGLFVSCIECQSGCHEGLRLWSWSSLGSPRKKVTRCVWQAVSPRIMVGCNDWMVYNWLSYTIRSSDLAS